MISSKQDDTTYEIKAFRGDMKSYMVWRFGRVESELDEIRTVLRAHGMIGASGE